MKKFILDYVCYLEGCKTGIKSLHWDARNLSQHKLCDDIAGEIADFQDTVSEVEQSISGNLAKNKLKGTPITVGKLDAFVKDVISRTVKFYKQLQGKGDDYIGLRSECEAFLTKMQRFVYLVNFTIKEDFLREVKGRMISESLDGNSVTVNKRTLRNVINEAITKVVGQYF